MKVGDIWIGEHLSDAMIESVHDIFLAFLSLEVFPGPSIEKPDDTPYEPPKTDMTALIGFSGAVRGGIHLACPQHVALTLAGSLSGTSFDTVCPDSNDALGELANMIAGGVQTRLASLGEIQLTPPAIISGSNVDLSYQKNLSSVKQYFKLDAGPFFVECFFLKDSE